jgi:hypothetical protein
MSFWMSPILGEGQNWRSFFLRIFSIIYQGSRFRGYYENRKWDIGHIKCFQQLEPSACLLDWMGTKMHMYQDQNWDTKWAEVLTCAGLRTTCLQIVNQVESKSWGVFAAWSGSSHLPLRTFRISSVDVHSGTSAFLWLFKLHFYRLFFFLPYRSQYISFLFHYTASILAFYSH